MANYKFTLKHQSEYASAHDGDPSGNKLEDMLLCVRKKMWLKLRGAKDAAGAAKKPASEFKDMTDDDMPSSYFFTGFMAFILFGPRGICHMRLSCLSADGKGIVLTWRAKERQKEAREKQAERDAGIGGHVPACYVRGVDIREKASAAQLAQFEASEKTRNTVGLLAIATQEGINLQKEFDRVSKAFNSTNQRVNDRFLNGEQPDQLDDVELDTLRTWKLDVLVRIQSNNNRKRTLEATSDRLLQEGPKKQVIAFYQQVGMFDDVDVDVGSSNNTVSVMTEDKDDPTEAEQQRQEILMANTQTSTDKDNNDEENDNDDDNDSDKGSDNE